MWHRRGERDAATCLLNGLVPAAKLFKMTPNEKVKYIYGNHVNEQSGDVTEVEEALKAHAIVLASTRVRAAVIPNSQSMAVQLFKAIFDVAGVFCLPIGLVDLALTDEVRATEISGITAIEGFDLDSLLSGLSFCGRDMVIEKDKTLFTVVHTHPERLVRATPSHIAPSTTTIRVQFHQPGMGGHQRGVQASTCNAS